MDIIQVLKEEHARISQLLESVGTLDDAALSLLVVQLAQELSLHEAAEETAVWYPWRRSAPDVADLEQAIAEETQLKQSLEETVLQLDDPQLATRVTAIVDQLKAHIWTEESRVFPMLDQSVDEATRLQMGQGYLDAKANALAQMAKLNIIMAPEAPIAQQLGASDAP